ncbi:MAG: hypothetical protein DRN99_07950 [Thermoproteota archaeon]|nr:MAG: hypothetical protein DRN99_07950 [Candidatus Korarchaeota archaeon]
MSRPAAYTLEERTSVCSHDIQSKVLPTPMPPSGIVVSTDSPVYSCGEAATLVACVLCNSSLAGVNVAFQVIDPSGDVIVLGGSRGLGAAIAASSGFHPDTSTVVGAVM